MTTGSGVYAVVHLSLLAALLQASHRQAARLAEHQERARITQDLHNLFGSSLVSIAVQSENALRHTPASTPAYRALSDISALARRAHDDVRDIVEGRASTQLHAELVHVQSLLTGADVVTRTTLPRRVNLPAPVSSCLIAVLRESVGNVLQHSQASRCDIEVRTDADRVRLSIDNDGVRAAPARSVSGSGLASLRYRVLALGGTLETERANGRFTLVVGLPRETLDPRLPLGDAERIHQGACP
ncbi:sensor histidine kinase [Streptomyces sp. NPDC056237]|uniref:sensor histidine kinase n=1 Tax=Streptomyces sp. NPDC056237 TaxID=3345758 RepID=UPI0035D80F85